MEIISFFARVWANCESINLKNSISMLNYAFSNQPVSRDIIKKYLDELNEIAAGHQLKLIRVGPTEMQLDELSPEGDETKMYLLEIQMITIYLIDKGIVVVSAKISL
jgi:hypothetical protein